MRSSTLRRPLTSTVLLLALACCGAAAGCGDRSLANAYEAYSAEIEPLLDRESKIYDRLTAILQERSASDPALPAYYEFLEKDAQGFYADLLNAVNAIEPGAPELVAAHEELLAMSTARFEFVTLELQARGIHERARDTEQGLVELEAAQNRAEETKLEYLRAVGTDVPDPRHTRLAQLVIDFQTHQLGPFAQGAKGPDELRAQIRRDVLPLLAEWGAGRLPDGERGRLLLAEIRAWEGYFKLFAARAPLFQEVLLAARKSTSAAQAGQAAKDAFLGALEDVRRKM